jgi:hypothetical protein
MDRLGVHWLDTEYLDWSYFDVADCEHKFEPLSCYDHAVCRWCSEPAWVHPNWLELRDALLNELLDIVEGL